jgi:hypothetical protein
MVISLAQSARNCRPFSGKARSPLRADEGLCCAHSRDSLSRARRAAECAPYRHSSGCHAKPLQHDGFLMIELLVALAIVIVALLPVAYSFAAERRLALASYQRAVAMEIVDGEMEALIAGEWRAYSPGTHEYHVHAGAATNLPAGKFLLTVQSDKVRLRWQPAVKDHGGPVTREALIK